MLGRTEAGTVYRVGADGARVAYRDGSVRHLAPFSTFVFSQPMLRIEGRLYPVSDGVSLGYEAPAFPIETK